MSGWQSAYSILKDAVQTWLDDNVPRMGASLAFYTVLAISPLLLIFIAIVGLIFGQEAASGHVVAQMEAMTGREAAKTIQEIIAAAQKPSDSLFAAFVGVLTLIIGTSGLFGELQAALNAIWNAPPARGGFTQLARARILSFGMVLVTGFLLLVSLVVSAVLAAMGGYFVGLLPDLAPLLEAVNFVVTLGMVTTLFAMIFKFLPDVHIAWRDVWVGAFITALLFSIGKLAIGLYLGRSGVGSAYGAAGSLVVLLVWVYYSAQILLFGAVMTQIVATRRKSSDVHRLKASIARIQRKVAALGEV